MERGIKLSKQEASAMAEIIDAFLREETEEYNLLYHTYEKQGNATSLVDTIQSYTEYLKLVEDLLYNGLVGLKKTRIQLEASAEIRSRKYLEQLYKKE